MSASGGAGWHRLEAYTERESLVTAPGVMTKQRKAERVLDPHQYQVRQANWHSHDVKELMPTGPEVGFLLNQWDLRVSDTVAETSPGMALDVGCGDARCLWLLQAQGWRGCGVDPSPKQLLDAETGAQHDGGSIMLVRAVAEHLPFKPRSFDVVYCKSAIDHVVDRDRALDDFMSAVKPGGRVVISAVNFGGVTAKLSRALYFIARRSRVVDPERPRFWDTHVPHEHTFEGTYGNLCALNAGKMPLVRCYGVSLFFGLPRWGWFLERLPERSRDRLLGFTDRIAHRFPRLADVVVCVWRRPD